jgi:outer membrane receptor for ferrienterochelin and colicin
VRRLFACVAILGVIHHCAEAGTTGILEGLARDKSTGEALPGVNVTIVGTVWGASSDIEGLYQVSNLPAGQYDVKYSLIGYRTLIMRNVTVLPDLRTRIDIELEVSAVELDAIEVRVERPLIQRDLPSTAYSVGEVKLEKLPVTAFSEVLGLQPGTTVEGNVRGGKINEVIYLVDGLPVQDVVGGGLGANLPKSAITGMTIHTGGFDAEYGNAQSGVVNVITKSGGNTHRFGVRLEKDDWLPERWNKQQNRSTELELFAGGPLVQDKLSYFSSNNILFSDTRWWQDFRRFFLSPVSQEFTGFTKLEYTASASVRLGLQGIYSLRQWNDYEFSWRFNLPGLPERKRNSYRIAATLSHTFAQDAFITLSLSRFYHRSRIGPETPASLSLQPYEYDFFLRYIVGGQRNWWADTRQVIYTVKSDFTAQLWRSNVFKAGFELNQYDISSNLVKYEPQVTYFGKPIIEAELLNYSNQYNYKPRSGSVFIQDKIELVRDGSSFSVGVRWDFLDPTAARPVVEFVPTQQNEYEQRVTGFAPAKFKHQFSPRLAFAAPVGPTSFFFMNFGHYFQYPLFDYLYSGINPAQLRTGTRSVLVGNPDLEPERTIAWEVGFKYTLSSRNVGSITYFKKSVKNQIDSKTLIPFDSKAAGDFGFAEYVNNSQAEVNGLEFLITQERSENLTGSISYTYMVTEGLSEYVDQSINLAQWGFPLMARPFPLSWDQRHTVKLDADFKFFWGIQTNLIVLFNSPRPFTFYPTRDGFVPLDTTKSFVPNNQRMRNVWFVNLKASRLFTLDDTGRYLLTVYVDGRNLLNLKNVRWMDSSGRIGGELGDPGAYYDPRRIRIGLRLEF